MKSKLFITIFAAGMMFLYASVPADAALYSFEIIDPDSGNAIIGEAQFFVDVTSYNSNQVLFYFTNTGPTASIISEVYFDDGSLLGIAYLDNSCPGVSFSEGAAPPVLPEGKNADPPFEVTAGFLADADNPAPEWGINPDEYLGIIFNLQGGQDFANVLDDLSSGALRIGLHVKFPDTDTPPSNSFINNPTPIPIPATVWMFGAGLIGLIGIRRKFVR